MLLSRSIYGHKTMSVQALIVLCSRDWEDSTKWDPLLLLEKVLLLASENTDTSLWLTLCHLLLWNATGTVNDFSQCSIALRVSTNRNVHMTCGCEILDATNFPFPQEHGSKRAIGVTHHLAPHIYPHLVVKSCRHGPILSVISFALKPSVTLYWSHITSVVVKRKQSQAWLW